MSHHTPTDGHRLDDPTRDHTPPTDHQTRTPTPGHPSAAGGLSPRAGAGAGAREGVSSSVRMTTVGWVGVPAGATVERVELAVRVGGPTTILVSELPQAGAMNVTEELTERAGLRVPLSGAATLDALAALFVLTVSTTARLSDDALRARLRAEAVAVIERAGLAEDDLLGLAVDLAAAPAPADPRKQIDAEARERLTRDGCAVCGHAWNRHDPEDGRCDAHHEVELGACPCGRDLDWMQERIAALSRVTLLFNANARESRAPAPLGALRDLHAVVVEQNRLGASWDESLIFRLLGALDDARRVLDAAGLWPAEGTEL